MDAHPIVRVDLIRASSGRECGRLSSRLQIVDDNLECLDRERDHRELMRSYKSKKEIWSIKPNLSALIRNGGCVLCFVRERVMITAPTPTNPHAQKGECESKRKCSPFLVSGLRIMSPLTTRFLRLALSDKKS